MERLGAGAGEIACIECDGTGVELSLPALGRSSAPPAKGPDDADFGLITRPLRANGVSLNGGQEVLKLAQRVIRIVKMVRLEPGSQSDYVDHGRSRLRLGQKHGERLCCRGIAVLSLPPRSFEFFQFFGFEIFLGLTIAADVEGGKHDEGRNYACQIGQTSPE